MEITDWIIVFFGGSGFVGLLSYFLSREKHKYDKESQMIDRLMKEIDRLDETVRELRQMLSESREELEGAELELMEERQKNAELNLLVIRLEDEVNQIRKKLTSLRNERSY